MWPWATKPFISVNFLLDRTIFGRDTTIWKTGIWVCKKIPNTEKIAFKVVQMKSLAMHISNQKWTFDIFTVGKLLNMFMEHDLYIISLCKGFFLWKIDNSDPFLAIATNIPVQLTTAFVVQGHICVYVLHTFMCAWIHNQHLAHGES